MIFSSERGSRNYLKRNVFLPVSSTYCLTEMERFGLEDIYSKNCPVTCTGLDAISVFCASQRCMRYDRNQPMSERHGSLLVLVCSGLSLPERVKAEGGEVIVAAL